MRTIYKSLRALTTLFIVLAFGINLSAIAGGHSEAKPQAKPDIVDTAIAAGSFTTLVKAVQKAELVEALKGDGPLTVFAPNDAAFAKFWPGTLDNLMLPENQAKLQELLLYHVVSGKIMSTDLDGVTQAETLHGGFLKVVAGEGVTVNYANVVAADIEASNGVIHVIDSVLIPTPKGQMASR
ncbi:MAG: fasciclin domain-containing protein [Gammaproteobacteria bacterium]|nr:fasciclin domain-containing protein [Gammaproteobacteria bacterium]NND54828.1 fasciclin domain-containing protein [Gammaproteobacteria bacterium]